MEETKMKDTTKGKTKKSKKRMLLVLLFIVVVAIYMLITLRGEYLNILEIGQDYVDVFKQNLTYRSLVMAINFCIVFVAVYITNKFIKKGLKAFFEEDKIEMPKLPNKSIALVIGVVVSILTSGIITEKAMLAFNTAWFGINDPIFNMDIGYYFFQKPFIELSLYYALGLIILLTIYVAVYYIVAFNVYFDGINIETLKKSMFLKQVSLSILLVAIVIAGITLVKTQDIVGQKFLNVSAGAETAVYGAGITDVTIKVWGYRIFAILIVAAVATALNFLKKQQKKKAIIALGSIPAYLVVLFIVMTGFQFAFVNPNELDKEKKYIAYNIENTKKAYQINIEEKEIENSGTVTIEQINNNRSLTENIPIITKDVTLKTLEEYQKATGYYTYRNANLATYSISGKNKLIYVSPREMMSDNSRTYNSKTYEYTHGYGTILSDATQTDDNGNIKYIQKNFDGSDAEVNISQPQIYFGLQTNNNIITNSKGKKEFDYPLTSSTNAENTYQGEAGLSLNWIDRCILGIKNGDWTLAFNTDITKDTKIIMNRNIIQRAKTIMPYLTYDSNPYMVIRDDGSLVWVLDAYTTSDNYPYSQESTIDIDGVKTKINYIRNSVKVLIDAYDGSVKFYLTDRSDPIAMAYRNIYPNLFMPLEEIIPEDISKHMVYPQYLYDIQAQMLTRYHNVQTEVLYRNDDVWSIAKVNGGKTSSQNIGTQMESYYTMLKTVDSEQEELGLVIPYTPDKKQNISAYLVGKYTGQNQLTLYKFKADDNVLGAMQLENQIERDEKISQELEAINTTGTKLIKNMIIVPIDNTLLYVEPVYQVLLNESQVPVLKKVIVASGNRVAIGNKLEDAINNLLSQQAVELEVQNTDSQEGLIESIIKANNNLKESTNNKDWELMGKDIDRLQSLINELEQLVEKTENKIDTNNINSIDANIIDGNVVDTNVLY